jgi:HK97 family phage major capsid protein
MPSSSEVWVAVRDVRVHDPEFGDRDVKRGQRIAGDCPGITTNPDAFEPVASFEARQRIRQMAWRSIHREEPYSDRPVDRNDTRDGALRSIERHSGHLEPAAADRLDELVRYGDPRGTEARYLTAVAADAYKSAFGKVLQFPTDAHLRFSREETEAVRTVSDVMIERALNLAGASGGFAVPFDLDPSIILTSGGATNPLRTISRVVPVSVDEWRGVSSAGVTASYAAEATETTDNAPTLVQPTISTEKAQAFIPFSIEVGQDWTRLQQEMSMLLADAKDVLEATKFATGTGTNEPFGVLTGVTNTINASTGQTFTLANLFALQEALPARYQPNASWVGDLRILNRIRQFTIGDQPAWSPGIGPGAPGTLLGKPFYEASEFPDTPATGSKFLVYGDFSRYVIAERVGLQVELVPHLFGANRRPSGERGLYSFWRNGAKVVDANAFRALIGVA